MPRVSRRKFLQAAAISSAALSQQRLLGLSTATTQEVVSTIDWRRYKLFYDHPASTWPDALPVGNGRLGAMVFGNPSVERVQLNEESIWDGTRLQTE